MAYLGGASRLLPQTCAQDIIGTMDRIRLNSEYSVRQRYSIPKVTYTDLTTGTSLQLLDCQSSFGHCTAWRVEEQSIASALEI